MSDGSPRATPEAAPSAGANELAETFDEAAYVSEYPDVAIAVATGAVRSGYEHYILHGRSEGRRPAFLKPSTRNRLIWTVAQSVPAADPAAHLGCSAEALMISPSGGILLVGWIDDSASPAECVELSADGWCISFSGSSLLRLRRRDVETALGTNLPHAYGYIGFNFAGTSVPVAKHCRVQVMLANGATGERTIEARAIDDIGLREILLSHLATAQYFGNAQIEAMCNLELGIGNQIVALNRAVTRGIVASPYVERFGQSNRPILTSIVVCLYGRAEYLFLQNGLFSGLPGIEDYEFVFVSNSPELAEVLLREAKLTAAIYGLRQTIVVLPGNAGFGAANNAAVRAAQSDRIINMNPDIFPRDEEWARKHTDMLAALPPEQTRLFGTTLYYDDGSLMHGGMYFELDTGITLQKEKPKKLQLARVEHYGKGAPIWVSRFTRARPIQAVTGAFISSERSWYEQLGGFTEDYVFGHYEDADICLKSIAAGTTPWIHDLRMWHLEGKGSTRRPVHEGGSLVNRWLFSKQWGAVIAESMLGPNPTNPIFDLPENPIVSVPSPTAEESAVLSASPAAGSYPLRTRRARGGVR